MSDTCIDDLLGRVLHPGAGRTHRDADDTERTAAASVKVSGSRDRLLVLAALAHAGQFGRTDAELERIIEKPRPTPGNRRGDLVALGLACRTTESRPHPDTGNPCRVWRITTDGLRVVSHLGGRTAVLALASKS